VEVNFENKKFSGKNQFLTILVFIFQGQTVRGIKKVYRHHHRGAFVIWISDL